MSPGDSSAPAPNAAMYLMSTLDSMRRKVTKALNIAADPRCDRATAHVAKRSARKIMAQHGWTEAEFDIQGVNQSEMERVSVKGDVHRIKAMLRVTSATFPKLKVFLHEGLDGKDHLATFCIKPPPKPSAAVKFFRQVDEVITEEVEKIKMDNDVSPLWMEVPVSVNIESFILGAEEGLCSNIANLRRQAEQKAMKGRKKLPARKPFIPEHNPKALMVVKGPEHLNGQRFAAVDPARGQDGPVVEVASKPEPPKPKVEAEKPKDMDGFLTGLLWGLGLKLEIEL